MKNPENGLKRIITAGGFSMKGLSAAYRYEAAFRQEVWLALVLIPTALWLGENWSEKTLLIGAVLVLLIVELLNSAIEAVVDRVGEEYHELSGRAKDMGSAAVFLTMGLLILIWASVLLN